MVVTAVTAGSYKAQVSGRVLENSAKSIIAAYAKPSWPFYERAPE